MNGFMIIRGKRCNITTDHKDCSWCWEAMDVACGYMRAEDHRSVVFTKHDPQDGTHTATVKKADPTYGVAASVWPGATLGVPKPRHTYKVEVCGNTYGPALYGHEGTMCNYSPGHWGKCGRTEDGPEPVKPKRPVKLRLTETEAALVLDLVKTESEDKSVAALSSYRDGTGYEAQCATERAEAKQAAAIVKRLRKALAKALDEEYEDE